ncbi:MAG: tetratricopeptide repeat protein, partial [Methanosarcinales archaeon]
VVCYDNALKINPKDAKVWNNKGAALYNLHKYDEAVVCYDNALKINPKDAKVWNNKGAALYNLNKYKVAIVCFDKSLLLNINYASAWNNKGAALYNLNKSKALVEFYDKAIEINPNIAQAWINIGIVFYNLKKYKKAINKFNKALEINPNIADVWFFKGNALYNLDQYKEAIECFDESLLLGACDYEIDINAKYYNNKGVCLKKLGQYEDAEVEYRKAITLNNNFKEAYYNLGKLLMELKRYEDVRVEFENFLEDGNIHGCFLAELAKNSIFPFIKIYKAEKEFNSVRELENENYPIYVKISNNLRNLDDFLKYEILRYLMRVFGISFVFTAFWSFFGSNGIDSVMLLSGTVILAIIILKITKRFGKEFKFSMENSKILDTSTTFYAIDLSSPLWCK